MTADHFGRLLKRTGDRGEDREPPEPSLSHPWSNESGRWHPPRWTLEDSEAAGSEIEEIGKRHGIHEKEGWISGHGANFVEVFQ